MNEDDYNKIVTNIEKEEKYEIDKGRLYRIRGEDKLKVIRRFELEGLMYLVHDHELASHFGVRATYDNIKDKYYWKGMMRDVEIYVKSCDKCQRRGKPQGRHELHSIKVKEPFYQMGIDYVGPLPKTKEGNKYIIVAMDYFTKWPEAKPVKEANAKETARFIYEDIICRHGSPMKILSDRGSHFNNNMIKELMTRFKIKHGFSTSYHPQTNGLVERFNKTLCEALAKLQNDNDWDERIAPVLFAYRNKINTSTKMRPSYLVYGRKLRITEDEKDEETSISDRVVQLMDKIPIVRQEAKSNVEKAQLKQKEYHDNKFKRKSRFDIGDKVLLYDAAKEKQWSGKLEDKWKGPYYIHKEVVNGSYQLKEINGMIMKKPVNGELLKIYYSREHFEPKVVI